eukprot:11197291-Lingulodinium_polyedra.AAC.2
MPGPEVPVKGIDPLEPPLEGNTGSFEVECLVVLAFQEHFLHVAGGPFWGNSKVRAEVGVEGLEEL